MAYILLIEDTPDTAHLMIEVLQAAGYEVTHLAKGTSIMPIIFRQPPALILMDFNLPDIDGRTLALTLKRTLKGIGLSLPIVAVTAQAGPFEKMLARNYGCDAFVSKPFDIDEFLAVVNRFFPLPTSLTSG